jgi:hypothetical protein
MMMNRSVSTSSYRHVACASSIAVFSSSVMLNADFTFFQKVRAKM